MDRHHTDARDRIVAQDDPLAEVTIYTLNWTSDHAREDEDVVTSQIHSRVVVNGEEIKFASGFTVESHGGDFVTAMIRVLPASIRFVHLDKAEFYADELPGVGTPVAPAEASAITNEDGENVGMWWPEGKKPE